MCVYPRVEDPVQVVSASGRHRALTIWLTVVTVASGSTAAGAWWTFRRHVDAGVGWGGLGMELGLFAGSVVIVVLLLATWLVQHGKAGLRCALAHVALLVSVWMVVNASSEY